MRNIKTIFAVFLLIAAFALAACGADDTETDTVVVPDQPAEDVVVEDEDAAVFEEEATPVTEMEVEVAETPTTEAEEAAPAAAGDIDSWLQQVNEGEIPKMSSGDPFRWGLGYFLYYGPLDTLGVDNLIYNALLARSQLESGEVTEENLTQNQQNLLTVAEEIEYDPSVETTDQVQQTAEARQAILDHFVESQAGMTPQEALDSDQFVGVFAPPAPDAVGAKYVVYTQESPDAALEFLGVILAVDATNRESEAEPTYTFQGWEDLPWLGDAAGPFWDDIPAGLSGDQAATDEGRPGVLLIDAETFEQIERGEFES